jgi:hypothetical protein
MLTRTKTAVLFTAIAACAAVSAEDPTPALSSSSAATGGSTQPLPVWAVPAAVAAAVITVGVAATNEDPLLQPPSH